MNQNTERLYHFVGDRYGRENIAKRHLKIAFADLVNDVYEHMPFAFEDSPLGDALRRQWQDSVKEMAMKAGFISFTENWHVPTMWAHYAENHRGIALGFDATKTSPDGNYITKVEYVGAPMELDHRINRDAKYKEEKIEIATKAKSSHWQYEAEWRAWSILTAEETKQKFTDPQSLFFVPFSEHLVLKEVIFGHRSTLTQVEVESVLLPSDEVKFTTARPSFQKFEMIAQK
jgi:hypothetical protein